MLVAALVALTGCVATANEVGDARPATVEGNATPTERAARSETGDPAAEAAPAATSQGDDGAGATDNETPTRFDWNATNVSGDVTARVLFTVLEDGQCSVERYASGLRDSGGPHTASILQDAEGQVLGWGSSGGGTYNAHALGVVDSRDVLDASGGWASWSMSGGTLEAGPYSLTILAKDTAPENGMDWEWAPGPLGVAIACEGGVVAHAFEGAREALLYAPGDMRGGTGATAPFGTHASMGDSAEATFTAARVESFMGWFGNVAGEVTVTHPGGEESRTFPDESAYADTFTGAPGAWRADVTLLKSFIVGGTFWGAIGGFDAHPDLASLEAALSAE